MGGDRKVVRRLEVDEDSGVLQWEVEALFGMRREKVKLSEARVRHVCMFDLCVSHENQTGLCAGDPVRGIYADSSGRVASLKSGPFFSPRVQCFGCFFAPLLVIPDTLNPSPMTDDVHRQPGQARNRGKEGLHVV